MIELITGLPGNAKTLYSLGLVIDRAAAENRAVYWSGLKGFKADDPRLKGTTWVEFDPMTWHQDVPSGAIMLIDEAQKVFRSRTLGTVPGKHVTELEEHRHKGLDFYMITQHPSLIDPAIRKLTQTHRHMVRIWGMEASTVHKWDAVRDNCDKPAGRKDSEKTKWAFNKSLYGLYHSADVHTMKRQIPGRVKALVAAMALLVAGVAYMGHFLYVKAQGGESAPVAQAVGDSSVPAPDVPASSPGQMRDRAGDRFDQLEDARNYVAMNTPRVEGLPHTAPKYDQITAPVRAPVPAACLQVGSPSSPKGVSCKCYTQQGTPMAVEFNMCIEFARNGYFQDFDAERDREQLARAADSERVLAARVPESGPSVQIIPYAGPEMKLSRASTLGR